MDTRLRSQVWIEARLNLLFGFGRARISHPLSDSSAFVCGRVMSDES